MVEITNVDVYDLEKSIIACRNAMRHRLREDWGAFCKMIQELPFFEEFINK